MRTEALETVGDRTLRVVRVDGRAVDAFDVYGASVWSEVRDQLADPLDRAIAEAARHGIVANRHFAVRFRQMYGDLSDLRTEHEVEVSVRTLRVIAYGGRPVVAFDGDVSVLRDLPTWHAVLRAMLAVVEPVLTRDAAKNAYVTHGLPDSLFPPVQRATVHHDVRPVDGWGT